MLIAVVNKSSLVSDADVSLMCRAIQKQLDLNFLPAWNLKAATIKFYPSTVTAPGYAWVVNMIDDDTSVPDALGFHSETTGDRIEAFIMCKPVLSNGGVALEFDPSNPGRYSVSATLSHEVLEMIMDRFTNTFCDNGNTSWCQEMCDPVEQIGYGIMVDGINVAVSDFVFPSFFNQYATLAANAPFNYLNTLKAPFTILAGGYAIQRTGGAGTETQVFGEAMPMWRREMKMKKFARAGRRIIISVNE